jgi:hypothetical protein
MRVLLFLICIVWFRGFDLSAQFLSSNSPVSLAQGSLSTTQTDLCSVVLNPAGTAVMNNAGVSINYFLPYTIKELSHQNILLVKPLDYGVASAFVSRFGYSVYNETRVGINFAREITPQVRASFQFNFQNNYDEQAGSGQQVFSGIGIQFEPSKNLILGFYSSNPEKSSIVLLNQKNAIPSIYALGLSWKANIDFTISAEVEKEIGYQNVVKFGMEYFVNNMLWLRTGVFGKPMQYSLGTGLLLSKLRVDVAVAQHQTLGLTSAIGLSYQFVRE